MIRVTISPDIEMSRSLSNQGIKEAYFEIESAINRIVGGEICPVHGEGISEVEIFRYAAGHPSFNFYGCCQEFEENEGLHEKVLNAIKQGIEASRPPRDPGFGGNKRGSEL